MKKATFKAYLTLIAFLVSIGAYAQVYNGHSASLKIKGAELVKINEQRKTVDYLKLAPYVNVGEQDHLNWLNENVLRNSKTSLVLNKIEDDKLGFKHYWYHQFYNNLRVEFGNYKAHIKNSRLESANGELYDNVMVNTTATIAKENAFTSAVNSFSTSNFRNDYNSNLNKSKAEGTLVILPKDNGFFLAYKFDIYALEPLKRAYVFVDAHTGKVIYELNRIADGNTIGTAITGFSGTQTITTDSINPTTFRLNETARGNGINTLNLNNGTNYGSATNFTDADNLWNSATLDKYAYDAHFGAEKTYDFYWNTFGRNSYDGAGAAINSYVHYSTSFVNAFWDGTQMTYGDGDGVDYFPLTSMEIVGHEITHAVTETSAGLIYSGESGALNESFSDIAGNTIRFLSKPSATWFVGDEILRPGGTGTPFRNMANPNQFDCADTYGGTFWNNGDIVHYDSGVQNFWFYLLSTGGSGLNDIGNSYAITGIGLNDAAAIAFRNLTVYLSPNSTFADARFYAIQSAVDLYGSCSNQVIQTTNAWYAVGVGGLFSNAVIAQFTSNNNYFCVLPASVNFINNSINATSYSWNFGDGGTSTLATPSHSYATAGTYTVTLIASGAALCGNSDTTVLTNYITVTNGGGPVTNSCSPTTVSYCCNAGITNFQFGTINKTSPDASEGYKDFTCGTATTLTAGNPVPITVTTSFSTSENVKCYIDYNNNGVFDPVAELVFTSLNKIGQHTGIVHTPVSAVLNTPLRMRVMDDSAANTAFGPCTNLNDGQAEDYTVNFIANTLPPIVDFVASDTVINVSSSVNFSDLTMNAPTGWQWSFPGGTPSTSTTQNPVVAYNTLGTYAVTLVATNSFGSDSLTKTMYIHVVNSINMCTGATSTTAPNGQLYDSGGPTGSYQDNESCTLLIDPGCAISVTLSFSQFDSESGYDYLRVYNGANATAPLILTANGSSLPPTVTANSGTMFITWVSDGSVIRSGWNAQWTSVVGPGTPPVAGFSVSTNTPPLAAPVQFTDQTTNLPIAWSWDFGDGQFSSLQNPSHSYNTSGSKTITLIATNCITSDTATFTVNVQAAPAISFNPDSISVFLACTDSVTIPLYVINSGSGDLVFNMNSGGGNGSAVNVLAMLYGVDLLTEYPNLIAGINQNFTNYNLDTTSATDVATLQARLSGKDVLLMPEQETGININNALLAPVIQNFVSNGGTLIVCGSDFGTSGTRMYDFGLFTGSYTGFANSGITINVSDTTDDLMDGIPLTFSGTNATFYHNITSTDKVELASYLGNDVVTYRNVGTGKAIYLGFDYFATNAQTNRIAANAIRYANSGSNPFWITVSPDTGTVSAGDSTLVFVTINSTGLNAGTYNGYINVSSNDPLHPLDSIPVHLVVSGPAEITMSDTCVAFGLITQFTTAFDTVTISNLGCDTLHVTSSSISNSAFSSSPSVFNVSPGDSISVAIAFNPQTVGNFSGTLTLFNNSNDTTICLSGASAVAPQIALNPDTINVALNCNDSTTIPVTVYNVGGVNLIYHVGTEGNGNASDTAILVIQDANSWGLNMSSYLQTNFGVIPTVITSSQIAATNFALYDIIVTTGAQSTSYYSAISTNKQKFENFVSAGGILQYQLAQMSGSGNTLLAGGASMVYGNLQNTNTGLIPSHPLLNGVVNPLTGNSANHCTLTNIPVGAQIISETGTGNFATTVEYNVGSGYVIATGMTWEYLFQNAYNSGQMLTNSFNYHFTNLSGGWLSASGVTDTVAAGDSSVFYVNVNSSELNAGSYSGYVFVYSNDPLHPIDSIPVNLTVSGPAEIALSDTCFNFGTIMQYTTAYDTLTISNNGCDTLHVISSSVSNNAYSVNPLVFSVAPGANAKVAIQFDPQTVGTFNAILTLLNNANDTTICLSGISVEAPQIAHAPSSLSASLNACADSITIPFTVYNTGGDSLNFSVAGANSGAAKKVLAMLYGVDLGVEYPTMITGINQYFTNYTLDTTYTILPAVLQTLLTDKDVLLMPEQETGNALANASFAAVIQNFVSSGGTVIICGSQYAGSENRLYDFGLFTGSYTNYITGTATLAVSDTTDDLMDGVPLSFQSANATFYHNITNIDKTELVSYNGNDVVSYREIGQGKAIFIGFDYFATNASASRIAANSIRYAGSGSLPGWITVTPTSGSLASNDSVILYATFNSAGLAGGTYNSYILIFSNDPLNPVDSIPVSLTVTNNPCADYTFSVNGCSGIVNFTDATFNNPTSWQWSFGDGGVSTQQNPINAYAALGSYNVQLIACNATSCDTIIQTVVITNVGGPQNATCSPLTTSYCCGVGITNVNFNTINQTSVDAIEGYRDFTCTASTNVYAGSTYTLTVTTGISNMEDVRAWIDFNNDGVFNTATEQVLATNNIYTTHSASVLIPLSAVVNIPLRMRVASEFYSYTSPTPCANLSRGQVEDYTVVILPNTLPPLANFTSSVINTCIGTVQFTDASQNFPTTWLWNFGDGNTSALQNPLHQYTSAGTYNVSLIAINAYGSDTTNYSITVNVLNAGFTVTGLLQQGQSLQFNPITTTATSYQWNFGDGFLSTLQAPQHIYTAPGTYIVALQVVSGACTVTSYDTLVILPVGINDVEDLASLFVSPNPFSEETSISYELLSAKTISIMITDLQGRLIRSVLNKEKQNAGKHVYKFSEKVAGTYLLEFEMDNFKNVYRIVKTE